MSRLRSMAGSFWIRAVVTVVLLGSIAFAVDWRLALDRLRDGDWRWFAAAVFMLVLGLGVGALRWQLLLRAAMVETSRRETVRAYAIGAFSNNFLPTSFGGDAARAWIVGRSGPTLVRALTSVAADRLSALACLVALAWLGLALDPGAVPRSLTAALLAATVAGSTIGALLVVAGGRIAGRLPERVRGWARVARDTLAVYARSARLVWSAVGLGLVFQALAVTAVWFLAKAIQLDLALALVAVAVPLVLLITTLPISIAGFGVREGGFIVLLAEAGVGATEATLLSLLSVAALTLSSLPGALGLLVRPPPPYDLLDAAEQSRPA